MNIKKKLFASLCLAALGAPLVVDYSEHSMTNIFINTNYLSVSKAEASKVFTNKVKVTGGYIQGYVDEYGINTFKGIPFADDTSGKNRFMPPQPVKAWDGIKDCTNFGPITVQPEANTMGGIMPWSDEYLDLGLNMENGRMSEDCLNLNVWSAGNKKDKLPVIVYIHGGANVSGSAQNDVYDGQAIAQKGVVYVSINYRVGNFGFLCFKDKNGTEIKGNMALQDQIEALKWVQKNIASFGGDPENVTIMGQSAGANNVESLIGSEAAKGLFKRAAALSFNSYTSTMNPMFYKTVEDAQKEAAEALGNYTVEDLQNMTPQEILALNYRTAATVEGGPTGTLTLKKAIETNKFNNVDLLWGGVEGDPYLFDAALTLGNFIQPQTKLTPDEYSELTKKCLADDSSKIMNMYPAESKDSAIKAAKNVNNDNLIASYYYASKKKQNADNTKNTYVYFYDHAIPDTQERMDKFGAFHSSDVNYWLNHYTTIYPRNFTELDYKIGDVMSSYLVNFATNGNPNGKDSKGNLLPEWKSVNNSRGISYMHIGDDIAWSEMDSNKATVWIKRYAGNK